MPMKKIIITILFALPVCLIILVNLILPYFSNEKIRELEYGELYIKHMAFIKRPLVDTVICGDSRVTRIIPDPFLRRHWAPFNMELTGTEPVDMAMEVRYALLYGKIKRLVLGVSFESMSEKDHFLTPHFSNTFPFTDPRINQFRALPQEHGIYQRARQLRDWLIIFWDHTKRRACSRLDYLFFKYIRHQFPLTIDEYGVGQYGEAVRTIKKGTHEYEQNRDPRSFFYREDCEAGFLKNKKLSIQAEQVYAEIFQELRLRKIPTVVFETIKLPSYQRMIDQDPMLEGLNEQWRNFFRKEAYGGIKFIEAKELAPYYYFDEFFDPVHFLGEKTEKALSEKLASALEQI